MVRMICLANSWRPDGRCVAGIDVDTGRWVRPIPPGGGAIPEERTWIRGQCIRPLDVIDLDLETPTFATRFQRENRVIRNWNWQREGRVGVKDVLPHCNRSGIVLHGRGKVVQPAQLGRLPPENWISLQLVHSENVEFVPHPRKSGRWEAKFSARASGISYRLDVTDPEATQRLKAGEGIGPSCLLTISLTAPIEFREFEKPPLCYKLVAAVIEMRATATRRNWIRGLTSVVARRSSLSCPVGANLAGVGKSRRVAPPTDTTRARCRWL